MIAAALLQKSVVYGCQIVDIVNSTDVL